MNPTEPTSARLRTQPTVLEDVWFPGEAEIRTAIQAQASRERNLAEAVCTAVDHWLRTQKIDPENPAGE